MRRRALEHGVLAVSTRLAAGSVVLRWVLCAGLLSGVALLDTLTGSEMSFSIFYLLPVSAAGALLARDAGRVVALLSACVWTAMEIRWGPEYSAGWIPIWNGLVRRTHV